MIMQRATLVFNPDRVLKNLKPEDADSFDIYSGNPVPKVITAILILIGK